MSERPVVVIVGAGFGGLNAAKALKNAPVQVVLVDKRNYHLFQPLLYQVATSGLADTDIIYPARAIFHRQENLNFRLAEVTGIDFNRRLVQTTTLPVAYDYLILAPGGVTNFFGLESVARYGFGLKNLDDAVAIRNHIFRVFELADQIDDPQLRRALHTFVVVGGGPTGVESAGAISELVRMVLTRDFRGLDLADVQITLLEMTNRLLAGFPESLGEAAFRRLQQKRVNIRLNTSVTGYDGKEVSLKSGEAIPATTLIWAAGVRSETWLDGLGLSQARQGRVVVENTMQAPGLPEVFVIGDAAFLEDGGSPLPMVAPVAIQQGKLAARNIRNLLDGKDLEAFKYRDPGSLATIGRNAAVAHVKGLKADGFFAWILWLAVHIFWLIGFRNRLLVLINWAWDYIFYDRAIRAITPDGNPATPDSPWPSAGEDGRTVPLREALQDQEEKYPSGS